jgi:hypothetical protein
MALTNYAAQVVLLEVLFARYHLGLPVTRRRASPSPSRSSGAGGREPLVLGGTCRVALEWLWRCLSDLRCTAPARVEPSIAVAA